MPKIPTKGAKAGRHEWAILFYSPGRDWRRMRTGGVEGLVERVGG